MEVFTVKCAFMYDVYGIVKVKVRVLLLYSAARPDCFSIALQPYPWQGTDSTLV